MGFYHELAHRCKSHAQIVVPTIAFDRVLKFNRQDQKTTTDIQNGSKPLECKLYQKGSCCTFQSFDNQEKLVLFDILIHRCVQWFKTKRKLEIRKLLTNKINLLKVARL